MTTSRLLLLSCAAATSLATAAFAQDGTVVYNDQSLNGQVFADQQLIVEGGADGLASATTAVGNSASGYAQGTSLDFESNQAVNAAVGANSYVQVYGSSGPVFINNTSATGNTGDAANCCGYSTSRVTQTTDGLVSSNAYSGASGSVDDVSTASTAIGNSHGYAAVNGSVEARTTQVNRGGAQATNQSVFCCVQGSGAFTATAVSNNVTSEVENGQVYHEVVQTASGDTRAVNDTHVVTGNEITGVATASANTVHTSNTGGYAELHADQSNSGGVSAESYVALDNWYGTGSSVAYGVGNSVDLVNISPDPLMRTTQVNDGEVSSVALFDGGAGENVFTSATSVGNQVSGYACSTCYGVIDATNRQVNNAGVRASARTYVAGGAGFVTSTSTAIGNTASYESRSGN